MTRFRWTFARVEAKQARAPRWMVTWGREQSITVAYIRSNVDLITSDTMGALEGAGFGYLEGDDVLIISRDELGRAGRVF